MSLVFNMVGGSSNFVRYDAAQELTDEQKAQARANIGANTVQGAVLYTPQTLNDEQKAQAIGNINAAPGGFGLGGAAKVLTPADNLNDVWQAGWYTWDAAPKNAPTVGGSLIPYCSMNVLNKGSAYNIHQIIYTFEGYEIHRYYDGAKKTWSEHAWVNPPMMVGVEYCTTKYYMGKPVYTQIKQFDNLTTEQSFYPGGNIIWYSGEYQWPYGDDRHWVSGMPTRQLNGTVEGDVPNIDFGIAYNTGLRLVVNAGSEIIGKSARVQVWYTK